MARACKISKRKTSRCDADAEVFEAAKTDFVIRLSIRVPIVTRIALVALSNCFARACSEAVADHGATKKNYFENLRIFNFPRRR